MKATTFNTIFWTATAIALGIHSMMEGWDAVCTMATIFGYSLLCFAAWLGIDNYLSERSEQ